MRMSDLRSKLRLWDSLRLKGTAPPVHDSPLPLPGQIDGRVADERHQRKRAVTRPSLSRI